MEAQDLDKECRALLGSLDGVNWIDSTPAPTEAVTGLEAELGLWNCPFHLSVDAPALPLVELNGAEAKTDQPAGTLLHNAPSPCSVSCFSEDATGSFPVGLLSLTPQSSKHSLEDIPHAGEGQCSVSLADTAEGSEALQLLFTTAPGLSSTECTHDAFWDIPWDDSAIRLCGAADGLCTVTASSPSHSLDSDSCQTILAGKRDAPANFLGPAQRAGSADSEASCASAAAHLLTSPLPGQACPPGAQMQFLAGAPAKSIGAPASPSFSAGPPPLYSTPSAPDQAHARPEAPTSAAGQLPFAAAGPPLELPAQASPIAAAARPQTGGAVVEAAPCSRPAARPLGHSPQPRRPRPMATVLKARQQQQAYHQRKKVRVAAVHALPRGLKERLAALEADVGALLCRHEELTRERPWHQQHEEVIFVAGLAPLLPEAIACHKSSASLPAASDALQSLLLEPSATINALCKGDNRDLPDGCQGHDKKRAQTTVQPIIEDPGTPDTTNIAWSSVLECLRLSRPQRDDIVALYKQHLQHVADAHQACLSIAAKVQVMPSVNGKLTQRAWPSMAGCLVSSQLSSQAAKEADMVTSLTAACHKVLSPTQLRNLQVLAPEANEDMRALCREVCAPCRAPRKAPSSSTAKPAQLESDAAQSAAHAPQECQVVNCYEPSAKEKSASFGGVGTAPQAAISPVAAVVPALGDDIISDLTSLPSGALHAAAQMRGIQIPQKAPLLSPSDAQPDSGDVADDMASMPGQMQLAIVEEVELAVPGNASAQIAAAAVVPACRAAPEGTALNTVVAQLAAVPSEATSKSAIAAAPHKRQAAASPRRPKVRPHEDHKKKARKMRSLSSL